MLSLKPMLNPVSLGQWKNRLERNYEWGNICVAVLCRNWRLFRHIFIASSKVPYRWTSFLVSLSSGVSAPRSWVLFHCEVACHSLAIIAACLARPLSLRFLGPLFRSLCSTRALSLVSGPSPFFSDFLFLRKLESSSRTGMGIHG